MPVNSLYAYQRAGVERLLKGSCLLADDMGLGKTVQVAYALSMLKPERVLIVCPLSMVNTWLEELAKWWPEGRFTKWQKGSSIAKSITHYEGLQECSCSQIDVLVYDEAHRLKNRKTIRSKTVQKLSSKSKRVWLLTGTPIMNRADEMWHLLHLIAPKQHKSYWNFVYEHCKTAPSNFGSGVQILPGVRNERYFANQTAPYVLRRTKEEVNLQLPRVTRQEHWLDMTGEQTKLHHDIMKQLLVEVKGGDKLTIYNALTRTVRARQCTTDPRLLGAKMGGCKQLALADLLDGLDERVIVFSQSTTTLGLTAVSLEREKRLHYHLNGNSSERVRQLEIEAWKQSKTPGVLLATIGAGGVGLTLTEASTVIFLDTPWVPAEIEQAIGRVDRVGQTKPVTVHFLLANRSIEQTVWKLLGRKTAMVEAINEEIRLLAAPQKSN